MTTLELEKSVTFKNILAATDFSDASRHALRWAEGNSVGTVAEHRNL
jgi:hypothetical protein